LLGEPCRIRLPFSDYGHRTLAQAILAEGNLKRSYRRIVSLFFVFVAATQAGAQQRGPSTTEERARAVQTAKSLQSDPLATNVQEDREWLVKWLIEVPDISVKMCTTFLGDLGDSKNGYPGAIIATMLASEAAFVVEHPDKAKDAEAVYFAGVDGALHGYEAIHLKDASYHLPHLDDLIRKRDRMKLSDYIHATAKKCKPNA
jgi:hypothetical protein